MTRKRYSADELKAIDDDITRARERGPTDLIRVYETRKAKMLMANAIADSGYARASHIVVHEAAKDKIEERIHDLQAGMLVAIIAYRWADAIAAHNEIEALTKIMRASRYDPMHPDRLL